MKNIAFIINPNAGTQNKRRIPKLIDKQLDKEQWLSDIVFTEYKGHATELAKHYAEMGFDAVVAVGGDGTVNEVASGLRDTKTALGIIPIGSGNGLARHLGVPLRVPNAIDMINHSEAISCDYGLVNDQPFFATCGSGFDAFISEEFQKAGKRGLKTYIEQIFKTIFTYKPEHNRVLVGSEEEEVFNGEAFLITIANCNQWGNAAMIAPKASVQDGKMDITIVTPFPLILAPGLALKLFTKTVDKGMYVNVINAKEATLIRENDNPFHLDGDPVEMSKDLHIRIVEDGLRVLAEKRF